MAFRTRNEATGLQKGLLPDLILHAAAGDLRGHVSQHVPVGGQALGSLQLLSEYSCFDIFDVFKPKF